MSVGVTTLASTVSASLCSEIDVPSATADELAVIVLAVCTSDRDDRCSEDDDRTGAGDDTDVAEMWEELCDDTDISGADRPSETSPPATPV